MLNGHSTIGQLAERTGCKMQTIRYYEQIGLIPEAFRTEGNQRRFGHAHYERLAFVRHCRELEAEWLTAELSRRSQATPRPGTNIARGVIRTNVVCPMPDLGVTLNHAS
jgi:MerR-like DNA binding protein